MKILFIFLLLLGCWGSAAAGESKTWVDEHKYYCDPITAKCVPAARVDEPDHPDCLQRMEAAMRAMEEYLSLGLGPRGDRSEKANRVYSVWDAVKQECWTMP